MADIDDLRAAFEQIVRAINTRNLDAFSALIHDEFAYFNLTSPFPIEGKAARLQAFQRVSAMNESVTITLRNPQFRIIGTTGVVWGLFAMAHKPKDGPMTTVDGRFTFTYVKSDGKWLAVAEHASLLPAGT
jgi:ketosteroid isomerase-like protein